MNVRTMLSRSLLAATLAFVGFAGTASAAPTTWTVDLNHSSVLFRISHFGAGHVYGRFNEFAGTIVFDDANPAASSVKAEIKATSLDTNQKDRDNHLRQPEFFGVAQFPTITFQSTAVAKSGDSTYDVTGDLTLHGVKKSITVKMERSGPSKDMKGKAIVGFEGTFTIKRSDYGISAYLPNVGDEVRVTLAFEAIQS